MHYSNRDDIQINVPYAEAIAAREQVVALMHPHNTEMDLSIAYAFFFAARASGALYDSANNSYQLYTSPARVLISGLGADEMFAGYSRHAAAYSKNGYEGLLAELELDIGRLGKRNLGRDDRVISHWGKEVRYPYLDENLLEWSLRCPIWEKVAFSHSDGESCEQGKTVLRFLARKLGMPGVSSERKRAVSISTPRCLPAC
jgi:asparagine synthetase B (glutamine-hydrolysing)